MAGHARRRRRIRAVVAAYGIGLLAYLTAPAAVLAQAEPTAGERALAGAVRGRFEVDLRPEGLSLSSADASGNTRVITLGDGVVAVDGVPVSGLELREAFGADADLVLRVTYLGETALQALFDGNPGSAGGAAAAPPPALQALESEAAVAPPPSQAPEPPVEPEPEPAGAAEQPVPTEQPEGEAAEDPDRSVATEAPAEGSADAPVPAEGSAGAEPAATAAVAGPDAGADTAPEPRTSRGDLFRVGGPVRIDRSERILGDATVFLGPLTVDGEVTGDVAVIGGSVRFGPRAVVRGDVTVVGGSLQRAPSAALQGSVTQVGLGGVRGFTDSGWWQFGWPGGNWFGGGGFFGTVTRLFFLALLASGIVVVARGPVERIARRATAEPLKAGFVGVLAQVLMVPLFVTGILVLVISIVGIPVLLLLPFAIMSVVLFMLVGFSGAVLGAGELVRSRMGASHSAVHASVWAGAALILLPTMAGGALGIFGGLFRGLGVLLALAGFFLEYAAWTAGLGALLLNRFSPSPPGVVPAAGLPAPSPPVPPPSPPSS